MPRIVPIQLLRCLRILLDDNGGILGAGEVKRLASLMTKYSKKLVSKCIYVQILKCTKTDLLGEFMGAGGWSLVYTWLNDATRAMNWPLVQEILELLLLCPVDVHRLKFNSAPKLVKGLSKDGGNDGVRILAKRLVEQWLKVVTEDPEAMLPSTTTNMTQQVTAIKTPTVAVVAPEAIPVNVQQHQTSMVNTVNQNSSNAQQLHQQQQQQKEEQKVTTTNQSKFKSNKKINKVQNFEDDNEEEDVANEEDDEGEEEENSREHAQDAQDPLGGVDPEPVVTNYTLTPAQKKASESGLVYKFIIKDGQSILAKVPPKSSKHTAAPQVQSSVEEEEEQETESNEVIDEDAEDTEAAEDTIDKVDCVAEIDDNSSSLDKPEKDNDSNSSSEDKIKAEYTKKSEDKKSSEDKDKSGSQKDRRSSKDKERRSSIVDKEKDKEKEKEKDREIKSSKSSSSSSSSHRSSSHKSSSSSSSKGSSSASSKSKSSSSSHRSSSSDKYRSDKERSSSSKDKDKDKERSGNSSSSSKHRSSSSSKSSSSSSSSSKDKHRDKEKYSSSLSSSSKSKDKHEQSQTDKDKATLDKVTSSSYSLDKLGKIPKKTKEESGTSAESENSNKPTSITIPSKKASMSIEIRKDTEKAKTVKTYKSQFRSHGLTEEAPPPPSRKGLKKPSSTTPPGTVLPSSLPSSLKRTSPPPRDLPSEKKTKIDINNVTVANEKPGAIKLIPPKKIQTLVETNLFADALLAATGPKKVTKRKRPNVNGKEGTSPVSPTSPDAPKVVPLKFYQDTLDESKTEDSKLDKENDESGSIKSSDENTAADDKDIEDDDDIPLKRVKEDIEQKVAKEKKLDSLESATDVEMVKDADEEKLEEEKPTSPSRQLGSPRAEDNDVEMAVEKKPGPGCGPNGPPGVLMLHRRKGPKKKLSWRPQESLEQIRYFELDENERCNVTKNSFMDMKNLEHFNERDAIVMARRGFNQDDNMEAQTHWKSLIEVDEVPPHPEGNQSKQRKIQADRELTTLRALYFTHALIPDSPAEAEFEPAFNQDVPLIPLDDLTGNPDAVNDFTSMPWPEPRGSPKQGDNSMSGTGGLGSPVDMFASSPNQLPNVPSSNKQGGGPPFNPFVNPFQGPNAPTGPSIQHSPQSQWQGPGNAMGAPMMGNPFSGNHGSPIMDMVGPGPMGPGPMMNNGPPQNFMNQFPQNFVGPANAIFMGGPTGFNNGPNNFGPMGPNGPIMNGMGPGPMGNCPPQMMNGGGGHNNNRNNNRGNNGGGGNWRIGASNFQDNNSGGNWRPAGSGPNNRGGGNNGICKAFMRGHCRLGNSCKYIHPNKSKRI